MGKFMSMVPTFVLGFWNAWILVIPLLIIFFLTMKVTSIRESGQSGDFQLTEKEKRIINAIFLPMIVSFVYSVFLPLQLGTMWLYSGLLVYLFGFGFLIVAVSNFATSPKDEVITKGLYGVTRNPEYIGILLIQSGLGIACASWLYLLLTVITLILFDANLSAEERYCLYKYGEEYRKYKSRIPRWIGIPKSKEE
jgi:protein-S-isoprenylcysteine O-methyltransferase Ste14